MKRRLVMMVLLVGTVVGFGSAAFSAARHGADARCHRDHGHADGPWHHRTHRPDAAERGSIAP